MLDYNPAHRQFIFTVMDETRFAQASFLDSRLQIDVQQMQGVALQAVDEAFPGAFELPPAAYLFHIGHCGSTLLSRALGATPQVLALREPLPLRMLASSARELGDTLSWMSQPEWERMKEIVLLALERRFRPDQLPVIKASSTCNNLVEPVLETHPDRRAVLLYQPLETSLAGVFRNRTNLGDLRVQGRERLQEWQSLAGDRDTTLASLDEALIAVLSWLASMQRFALARQRHPDRVLMVDFNRFLADPTEQLPGIAHFIGLGEQAEQIAHAYDNVCQVYAKDPSQPYTPERRQSQLNRSRRENAEEIRRCLGKARDLIGQYPDLEGLAAYLGD